MKVLVINNDGGNIDIERDVLEKAFPGQVEVKFVPSPDRDLITKEVTDADAVISVCVDFDKETIATMKNCKIIATQTIGFDTINLKAATEAGIYVTNNPDYCVEEVAAQAVTLILACNRNIVLHNKLTHDKVWDVDKIYAVGEMHRISDATLGVVAFGHIGKRVAKIMQGMGMNVIVYDPFVSQEAIEEAGVTKVDTLEALFSAADIITLHTPLTPKTEKMVDMHLFDLMKKNAILINTSRGGIVDEDDLYEALKAKKFAGAGLDVIVDEKNFETKLYDLDQVIITPHIAYYTEEALEECRRKSAEQIVQLIKEKEVPKYLVNMDIVK